MSNEKTVLVLDGNSSQCLPVMQSLYKKGYKVVLVCPGVFSAGYFSRYASKRLIWPKITYNEDKFYEILINHISLKNYEFIIGLSDKSTELLSKNKRKINQYTKNIVPEYSIYMLAADKYQTMQICMDNNIPCPVTLDAENLNSADFGRKLKFPVVIKPKVGVGAVGFTVINNQKDLEAQLPLLKNEYRDVLIQEYIPNQLQFTAEVFCDKNSSLKACVISEKKRFFPIQGGTSSCNVTVHNSEITEIIEKLLLKLKWTGPANVDLIFDPRDQIPKVIEINPRIGATVKLSFLAGIDMSNLVCKFADGSEIEDQKNYIEGIVMRNLMLDILWYFFSSIDAKKKVHPPFAKFFGEKIYYQSLRFDDPFPIVGFIGGNIIKYADFNKIKKKLGIQ